MKVQKFADKKKELLAIITVGVIVILVSGYVIYLIRNLSSKVYDVFDQSTDGTNAFVHFDFNTFDGLGLKSAAVPPAASSTKTAPATTTSANTTTSS